MDYTYVHQHKINFIKDKILNDFNYGIYDYEDANKKLKESKYEYLEDVINNEKLFLHLVRSAIHQLKIEKKVFQYSKMRGIFIYDDFDPLNKFVKLLVRNSDNKRYFYDTYLTKYLEHNTEAVLPNVRKLCFFTLFEDNSNLIKYFNFLKLYFSNIIFINETEINFNIKDFITKLIETDKLKKYGANEIIDYFNFILNSNNEISKHIELFNTEIKVKKTKNICLQNEREFIDKLLNTNANAHV